MNRTWNVVRMQLVNRNAFIWLPLIVLGSAFVLSLAIYAIIPSDGPKYGGGGQAPLWYFLALGIQALTLTFPFSQALSVTRREYFLGTTLTAAITAAILSVVFVAGGYLEAATGGWGVNGWFFRVVGVWDNGPFAAAAFAFVLSMFFFVMGFWAATIYKRFGPTWLTLTLVAIGVVLIGAVWLITVSGSWPGVIAWFAAQGVLGVTGWGVLLVAVLSATAFLTLRRATP